MVLFRQKATFYLFHLRVGAYHRVVYTYTSNRRFFTFLLICCRLFVGPIASGYLCSTLGFEWAAAMLSFTGLFVVSFCFLYSQNVFKVQILIFWISLRCFRCVMANNL